MEKTLTRLTSFATLSLGRGMGMRESLSPGEREARLTRRVRGRLILRDGLSGLLRMRTGAIPQNEDSTKTSC